MRAERFLLSSSQVILAIINGNHRHCTIHEATKLHANTVSAVIRDLINQGYVKRFGDTRPYIYRATAQGKHLAYRLLRTPNNNKPAVQ